MQCSGSAGGIQLVICTNMTRSHFESRRSWSEAPFPFSVAENRAKVMKNNKSMKVFVTAGYYDYACPFATINYALDQLLLEPELRDNVIRRYYHAGHMVYTPQSELPRFTQDVRQFVIDASGPQEHP